MASPHHSLPDRDISEALGERIRRADAEGTPLRIVGGDTKAFHGRPVDGEPLSTREHRGITHYDPVELIVSVRAGTPLAEMEARLDEQGQRLPFEPPHFGDTATVGGMVATGLSGPRRPWAGSVRDFVLGIRLIDRHGESLRFGGEVMKNVAGYDLSRLMVGAQGCLGLLAEVSLKVLPKPAAQHSLRLEMPLDQARRRLIEWGRQPLPITAATWFDGALHLRLEGGPGSVEATRKCLGGDTLDDAFWSTLREQRLDVFTRQDDPRPLWRLSLPQQAPTPELEGVDETAMLHDWAGAQRWLRSAAPDKTIHDEAVRLGGHATRWTTGRGSPFTPLSPVLAKYHRRLKAELDPNGIFNPGRLYAEL
ncbi:glycolate oxidase subunit GlcE [Halomonas caseinilytica]|uniref:glycolate oxidase subunit GlcE n=1 Tax=Halomonas caseinilytica TaxID=438744 RepID=UPI0007E566FF|nr:glycolate oxidase subunit GlcE [Halomonas caseinilytica]SEN36265.1 glycolate oxidase FAD binding subunit [Halomonas caseinilytica]